MTGRVLGCLLLETADAVAVAAQRTARADYAALLTSSVLATGATSGRAAAPTATLGDRPSRGAAEDEPVRLSVGRPLTERRLAGTPLIEWVLRRASEAQGLHELVVVLPNDVEATALQVFVPSGARVIRTSPHLADPTDRLARLCDCWQQITASADSRPTSGEASPGQFMGIVSLRLDCPLLDPCLLDRLIQAVTEDRSIDYGTYCSSADTAVGRLHSLMQSQLGLFAEYFRADALLRLDTLLTEPSTRREPAGYLWGGPDGFKLRLLSLPAPLDRSDLRLTLRHPDDWDHAEQIVEALGYDHLDWQGIAELLHTQPSLRQHMARLNLAERDECGLARE